MNVDNFKDEKIEFVKAFYNYSNLGHSSEDLFNKLIILLKARHLFKNYAVFRSFRSRLVRSGLFNTQNNTQSCPHCGHGIKVKIHL
jgi:hypothetical protein